LHLAVALLLPLASGVLATPQPGSAEHGLMQGFPPAPEQRVGRERTMLAPFNRWAFQHIRELHPTRAVNRDVARVSPLAAELRDLGGFSAPVRAGRVATLGQLLDESHTDAFLVLHRGRIVYERYLNGMQPHAPHLMFSCTKSFVGTMLLMLIEQGRVDAARPVSHYVPELAGSAFGDASVQQVLDMTTAIRFEEVYADHDSDWGHYGDVFGMYGATAGNRKGPTSIFDYLPTLKKDGAHGQAFHYVTPNTDVLGWILSRVTGLTVAQALETMLWQPLGAEYDGYFWLDGGGREMAGAGLNITPRDAARFGQMILQQGRYDGRQVIPAAVAARILRQGNAEIFTKLYPDDPWYGPIGHSYHDQWWSFNNAHQTVSAIGIHGQYIWLDPVAQMVIVKVSSSPDAENGANDLNDSDLPLLYPALAEHLMSQ
jgi:CubicO group peptidase (beta-lactamase class C family)